MLYILFSIKYKLLSLFFLTKYKRTTCKYGQIIPRLQTIPWHPKRIQEHKNQRAGIVAKEQND